MIFGNIGYLAFYGTNTPVTIQNILRGEAHCSCSTFTNLGTTDPMSDSNWIKTGVLSVNPWKKSILGTEERTGGIAAHRPVKKKAFEIQCSPFVFPDEILAMNTLINVFDYQYVYMYKGTYNYSNLGFYLFNELYTSTIYPTDIHPDSYALFVAVSEPTPELDSTNGCYNLKLTVESVY